MSHTVTTDRGTAMLAVIEEIVAEAATGRSSRRPSRHGGRAGRMRWRAGQDDVERPGSWARWIRATLQAHRMKTLESEYPRFLRIYRAGVEG